MKCNNCEKKVNLAEIVNRDMVKADYVCIDCATDHIAENYDHKETFLSHTPPVHNSKLTKLFKFMFGATIIMLFMMSSVLGLVTESINYTPNQQGCSYTDETGIRFLALTNYPIVGINITIGSTAERVRIYDDTPTLLGTASVVGNYAEFPSEITISSGSYYRISTDKSGAQYCFTDENPPSDKPVAGTLYNTTSGYYDQWSGDNYIRGVWSITFNDAIDVIFPSASPLNDTGINENTILYYNVSASTDCNVSVNGTIKDGFSANAGLNNFTYLTSWGTNGDNVILLNCSGYTNSSVYYQDTVIPVYNYVNGVQLSDGLNYEINGSTIDENFNLNISISDSTNLWSFNVSLGDASENEVDYNNYTNNLNVKDFVITDYINLGVFVEGSRDIWIEVCDGHTAKSIPDYKINKKSFGVEINDRISIVTDVNLSLFDLIKQTDRYNFKLDFLYPVDEFEIEIESIDGVNIVPDSAYTGHVIVGKKWIDFVNTDFELYESVSTFNKVIHRFRSIDGEVKDGVTFNSIGDLNCIDYNATFTVDSDDDTVNLSTPKDKIQINTTGESMSVLFNYIPYYNPTTADNCTLYLNNTVNVTDLSINKNVNNTFNVSFDGLDIGSHVHYEWQVKCSEVHFHPPITYEEHIKSSDVWNFTIFNTVTTTSTTSTTSTTGATTTTEAGASVPTDITPLTRVFFILVLMIGWIVFIFMSVSVRPYGKTVQFFNIAQLLFGFVLGSQIMIKSSILGFGVSMIAVGLFLGFIMNDR